MTRTLKVLGIALVAVFAMSAVFASIAAAAADDLTAESYPVTLTGEQEVGNNVFKTTAGSSECKKAPLTATVNEATTEVTAAPLFSECTCIGVACVVDVNGCTFTIKMTEATTSKVDLVCPAGKEITLTSSKCVMHVPAQADLGHILWTNIGSGATREVTASIKVTNIKYAHTAGEGIGKCTTGSGTTGSLEALATVTGENALGHVGIFFS